MNDDAAPLAPPIANWIHGGRALADRRGEAEWALADWLAEGRAAGHMVRLKYTELGARLGIAAPRLKAAVKASLAFPAGVRVPYLSVDHHSAIASLPSDEALPLLRRAVAEGLPPSALREVVTQRRYATGQNLKDDDPDSTLATLQIRAWNRATPEARSMAFEQFKIAARNGHGIVDEDEAFDA